MKRNNIFVLMALAGMGLPAMAQNNDKEKTVFDNNYLDQMVDVGADVAVPLSESTASVSIITSKTTDKRGARNIGNSIIGQGVGLQSLRKGGVYASSNPTMYVRGLQSLSGSAALVLVDGIERGIDNISPEEVESVSILKDVAATALYGYKGANGVILITTKRGIANSKSIKVTYDHEFNNLVTKPKFVDGPTYAMAMNEARANDGLGARYTDEEIAAFKSGQYPCYYPNVDWINEVFRNHGVTNKYGVEFRGGANKFRYYTLVNLLSDKGFIKEPFQNEGYSTQDKYVRGNLRVNLDFELTKTTKMKANIFGTLDEQSKPGSDMDIWSSIYSIPSAAYPVKDAYGNWGGNSTWTGTSNPVAQATGAAYYKYHNRALFTDLSLDQDLSSWIKGLHATARIAYDVSSTLYEDHSKTYKYGMDIITGWENGIPVVSNNPYSDGKNSEMGTGSGTTAYNRRFYFDGGFNYSTQLGEMHSLYTQLKWNYEFQDKYAVNSTIYRQNASLYARYAYDQRLLADFALVASGSSRLAPGHKWALSPTISGAWIVSRESWMKDVKWVDYLKLRVSFGMLNMDLLPNDSWTYYSDGYSIGGVGYLFDNTYNAGSAPVKMDRMATINPSHEKAYKYNIGIDSKLLGGLDFTVDAYYQRRSDIWVETSGKYTALAGFNTPYANDGRVNTWGIEAGLDYNHRFGEVDFNLGGTFAWNKNKVKNKDEEPRAYDNLVETGEQLNQIRGLRAIGFFKDEADIANSPQQLFSTCRPGDIKYEDVNHDGVIDKNDYVAIGYTSVCPEIYYQFHLGAEWKGLGITAMFQGVGRFSGIKNISGGYYGLVKNTNLFQDAYDHRWTEATAEAAQYPRLSSQSNSNNYQNSTLWLFDRSFLKLRNLEVYYNLPKTILDKVGFLHAAKVYVRGVDLFTFDHVKGMDAEYYSSTQPLTRSVVAGVQITF